MSAWIKRKQPDELPIVFSKPFTGPADLDRQKAIPFDAVLQEVERNGGDGQGRGEAFEGRDNEGQELVEALDDAQEEDNDDDEDNDYYEPAHAGGAGAGLRHLEAARRELQRAAAAQQQERITDAMQQVRNNLGTAASPASSGAGRNAKNRSSSAADPSGRWHGL